MAGSGRLMDYLGRGAAADRPDALILQEDTLGVYWATDTHILSLWDQDGGVWDDFEGASVSFAELTDVDFDPAPSDGQVFVWQESTGKLVPWSIPAPGIADAPNNTNMYVRKGAGWVVLTLPQGLPGGGVNGKLLGYTGGAAAWVDPPASLPGGGTTGQVLTKASATDGDAGWMTPAAGGGGGGAGPVAIGAHRYWGIFQIEVQTGGQATCMGEIQFRTATGGAAVIPVGGQAALYANLTAGNIALLTDNNAATELDNFGNFIWFDFGSAKSFVELFFQARSDFGGGAGQAIKRFWLHYSDDGIDWLPVQFYQAPTYAAPGSSVALPIPTTWPMAPSSSSAAYLPPIDISGFSVVRAGLTMAVDQARGVDLSVGTGAGTSYWYAVRPVADTNNYDVIARVQGGATNTYSSIGLIGRNSGTGAGITAQMTWTGAWAIESDSVGNDNSRTDGNGINNFGEGGNVWLRIRRVGGQDPQAMASPDGKRWYQIRTVNGGATAIDQIGIMVRRADSAINAGMISFYNDGIIKWSRPDGAGVSISFANPLVATAANGWTAYTPVMTAQSGTINTVDQLSGAYLQYGDFVFATVRGRIVSNGTGAGAILMTLPPTLPAAPVMFFGTGQEGGLTGGLLQTIQPIGPDKVWIQTVNVTYPGADGAIIQANFYYRTSAAQVPVLTKVEGSGIDAVAQTPLLPSLTSGLLTWLKTDKIVGAPGDFVNLIPGPDQLHAPGCAVSVSTGVNTLGPQINGKNCVRLSSDTKGQWDFGSAVGRTGGPQLRKLTWFVVMRPANMASGAIQEILGGDGGMYNITLKALAANSLTLEFNRNGIAGIGTATGTFPSGVPVILSGTYDQATGNWTARAAKASIGSGTNVQDISGQAWHLGSYQNGSGTAKGTFDFAEMILVGKVMTLPEIVAMEAYLGGEWGL